MEATRSRENLIPFIRQKILEINPEVDLDKIVPQSGFKGSFDILVSSKKNIDFYESNGGNILIRSEGAQSLKILLQTFWDVLQINCAEMKSALDSGLNSKKVEIKVAAIELMQKKLGDSWSIPQYKEAVNETLIWINKAAHS